MDEKARDQFVIRAGTDTEVLWNDARQSKPELVYKRSVSELQIYNLSVLVSRNEHSYLCLTQYFYLSITTFLALGTFAITEFMI